MRNRMLLTPSSFFLLRPVGVVQRLIAAVWVGLLLGGGSAVAYASDWLPLEIGNSWEYWHVRDYLYDGTFYREQLVTIRITHTEDIEGHTYYVFSDLPYMEPTAPAFFLAGQKVRWEDNHLLVHQQGEDVALYQFKHDHSYPIPKMYSEYALPIDVRDFYNNVDETYPDTLVFARKDERPGTRKGFLFLFRGSSRYDSNDGPSLSWNEFRTVKFVDGMGLFECLMEGEGIESRDPEAPEDPTGLSYIFNDQGPEGVNHFYFHSALINGVALNVQDIIYQETVVRGASWGVLKRSFSCSDCED